MHQAVNYAPAYHRAEELYLCGERALLSVRCWRELHDHIRSALSLSALWTFISTSFTGQSVEAHLNSQIRYAKGRIQKSGFACTGFAYESDSQLVSVWNLEVVRNLIKQMFRFCVTIRACFDKVMEHLESGWNNALHDFVSRVIDR